MYLIILNKYIYRTNTTTKEIKGYKNSLEEAKEWCEIENGKLDYNSNLLELEYIYKKIEEL